MTTYQDYEKTTEKESFILKAVNDYKGSAAYLEAVENQAYYARNNTAINRRMTFMEKHGVTRSKVKFFKLRNGFCARMCKQLASYLLGNGVNLPSVIKEQLGAKFDSELLKAGNQALVDGVNWLFWNLNSIKSFRATEFVPLLDETTGELRAGIRFWQIDDKKPMNIELYESDGITKYTVNDKKLTVAVEKDSYIKSVRKDGIGEEVVGKKNYDGKIPIFPFYANELKTSEITAGLKEHINAHDFINSDLADGITQIEGIMTIVKNYGGQELVGLVEELRLVKIARVEDDKSQVDVKSVEIPYQAKQIALGLLTEQMYEDTMTLNTKAIQGGSLTNVAINVAMTDLDLKADTFETCAVDVVSNILDLIGVADEQPKFKRRTIVNDTEMVTNISAMLADGYIDDEWAIKNNPLIADEEQGELLKRIELAKTGVPPDDKDESDNINSGIDNG